MSIEHISAVEVIKELKEENKNLKLIQETNEKQIKNDIKERDEMRLQIADLMWERDGLKMAVEKLEEENKKLKEKLSELEDVSEDYDLLSKDFIALGEENENLNEKLKRKEWIIANLRDDIQTLELWLDNKEKLNEEYRKQIDKYKAQYEHQFSDFWWYDDELIYEEWLYD